MMLAALLGGMAGCAAPPATAPTILITATDSVPTAIHTQVPTQRAALNVLPTDTPIPATASPTVTATNTQGSCTPNAEFEADVTLPDNTAVMPGAVFTKTWRMHNSGTCDWNASYSLV